MSTEIRIWRIEDDKLTPTSLAGFDYERDLQEVIADDVSIVGPRLMVIGTEVETDIGGRIDVLAIDADGNLVVIELKRDRMPREVVAQVLEYGEWVRRMNSEMIASTFDKYQSPETESETPLGIDDAMREAFGAVPDELNISHQLVVVAAEMDPATERIVTYLQEEYGVSISVALFRAFQDEDRRYLTRAWMNENDPSTGTATQSPSTPGKWNGECYVSFGEGGERRSWSEARRYGFVSAGGGDFYTKTLKSLQHGERIWVKISELKSGNGYVAVGTVNAAAVRVEEFMVQVGDSVRPFTEVSERAKLEFQEGEEEYYVGVDWHKECGVEGAVWQRGFFANQNTVARPKASSWTFTVEFLKRAWGVE